MTQHPTEGSNRETEIVALRRMLMIRAFEEQAYKLIKSGDMVGVMHSSVGQEAACVGACLPLRSDDYITGTHRSHGHPIAKGARVDRLVAELMGRSTGVCGGMGGSMHLADFSIGSLGETAIVGSSIGIGVGAALSAKLRGEDRVCLVFFGDGASNTGICHEGMNLAAVWKLPVVFLVENNQYAVSTPISQSTSVDRIARRAAAYGIPGETVDGQDFRAVRAAVEVAVARARRGDGPSIVEALTYRYDDHAFRLGRLGGTRDADEVAYWKARDPIAIHADRLLAEGVMSGDEIDALRNEVAEELSAAVRFGLASDYPDAARLHANMYESPVGPEWSVSVNEH